ncbi:hypothetical protein J6590_049671 [Homalodisca vitripennis]|nr:hypothetical protein J6590_049671 [Homalodisca vitripennis]
MQVQVLLNNSQSLKKDAGTSTPEQFIIAEKGCKNKRSSDPLLPKCLSMGGSVFSLTHLHRVSNTDSAED